MKDTILRLNKEFRTLYYRGTSQVDPLLIVFVRKNRLGYTRTGITTGKKVGNAVQRSRSRRVIRAAYRSLAPQVKPGYDLVFVARARTATVKSTAVAVVMERLLAAMDVLQS